MKQLLLYILVAVAIIQMLKVESLGETAPTADLSGSGKDLGLGETAFSADLGSGSKDSIANFEGRRGE